MNLRGSALGDLLHVSLKGLNLGHLNFIHNTSSSFLKNMLSFKLKLKEKLFSLYLLIHHSLLINGHTHTFHAFLTFFSISLPYCCAITSLSAGYLALQWLAGLIGARDRWSHSVAISLVSGRAIAHTR